MKKWIGAAVALGVVALLGLTDVPGGLAADRKKEFVGSERCKACHSEEFKSWKESFHSKMVQPRKGGILKDAVEKWKTDGAGPGPTKGNVTGAPFTLEDVQFVIGSRWKQRFLVKNEQTGNLQFMDKQFNRYSGKWENYGQKNDWNAMCTTCHTTGYRILEYDEKAKKTVKSDFSELGIGCEACHGPGAQHVAADKADKKKTIFNPANADIQAQSKTCGYCHIRVETEKWHSAQGNPREDMPAPKLGDSYKAGDDWTKWEGIIMPGLQPDQPFTKEYAGDLKGMFNVDDHAKANGIYEEAKHHQQYQGFVQSAHFQKGAMSCITCHSPHAGKGKLKKVPKDACQSCHDASYTVEKYMPNTGQTALGLFVRSHTFNKNPRKGGAGASNLLPPDYYE
jgi:hypothetical protein